MTPDERRAEQLLEEIDTLARDFDLYEFGLPLDNETRDKMRVLVIAFARDAEARGWEGAAEYVGDVLGARDLHKQLKEQAQRLREGSHDLEPGGAMSEHRRFQSKSEVRRISIQDPTEIVATVWDQEQKIRALEQRVKDLEAKLVEAEQELQQIIAPAEVGGGPVPILQAKLAQYREILKSQCELLEHAERERDEWRERFQARLAQSDGKTEVDYVEYHQLLQSRDRLRDAMRRIANYDQGSGCCAYGCDTPSIAQQALKEG